LKERNRGGLKEKQRLILELKAILKDPKKIMAVVKKELLDIKTNTATSAGQGGQETAGSLSVEDLIPEERLPWF